MSIKWQSISIKLGGSLVLLVIAQLFVILVAILSFVNFQDDILSLSKKTIPRVISISEINNQMNSIWSQLERISRTDSQAQRRLFYDTLQNDIDKILGNIESVNDPEILSHIQNQLLVLNKLKDDLNEVVIDIINTDNSSKAVYQKINNIIPDVISATNWQRLSITSEQQDNWFIIYFALINDANIIITSQRLYEISQKEKAIKRRLVKLRASIDFVDQQHQSIMSDLTDKIQSYLLAKPDGLIALAKKHRRLNATAAGKKNFAINITKDLEAFLANKYQLLSDETDLRANQLTKDVKTRSNITIATFLFSVLVAVATFYFLSKTIIKRLINLTSQVRDKTQNEHANITVTGYDEITDIASSVTFFANELAAATKNAEQASKAKSDFLATMSHEIRTPMSGVLGMTYLLSETDLTKQQKDYLNVIQKSGELMLHVINDILDFSKLEVHQISLEKRPFNLQKETHDLISIFYHQAETNQIKIIENYSEGVNQYFNGDMGRIQQLMTNFIGNALKFTAEGVIKTTLSVTAIDDDKQMIRFEVEDNGIGIEKDKLDGLFESFVQADSSISRKYGGSGLGLAICKGLVTVMNGTIGAESEFGKGSSFWFEIPLPLVKNQHEDITKNQNEFLDTLQTTNLSTLRILVAEDIVTNQLIIKSLIERSGHVVDVVENGYEAIEAVNAHTYDVVFMDLQMPEMDGLTATRAIREINNSKSTVPIIAITANATDEDRTDCLEAGMNDFLTKPIDVVQLDSLIYKIAVEINQ